MEAVFQGFCISGHMDHCKPVPAGWGASISADSVLCICNPVRCDTGNAVRYKSKTQTVSEYRPVSHAPERNLLSDQTGNELSK